MDENEPKQQGEPMNPVEGTVPQQTPAAQEPHKAVGPAVGIVIIVLVVLLGGIYFWLNKMNTGIDNNQAIGPAGKTAEEIAEEPDPLLNQLGAQNTSDTVEDIEADLNATDLESIDKELENINLEL